jgi:xanthine dehydrogenase iron-sulfur cluster and FAD-binding subunit A
MWHDYYNVTSLEEVLQLLSKFGRKARIVAGGTDIILEMERGQRPGVEVLLDISRIQGLDRVAIEDGIAHVGPLVTHNMIVGNSALVDKALPFATACWEVGAPQIRNRGTVAGNVITASPANDTITPLWAMGASVTLQSLAGERTVSLDEFYTGVRRTVMRDDEMLVAIHVPLLDKEERGVFLKLGLRRAQAISVVNVAVVLRFSVDRVETAKITLGSVAPTIVRAREAEAFLQGKALTHDVISAAAALACKSASPIDDVRGSASYRLEMVRVLTARALRALQAPGDHKPIPDDPPMLWGKAQGHGEAALTETVLHSSDSSIPIETIVNGRSYSVEAEAGKSLLRFIRDDIGLTGTKEGCSEGECGACTVFLDGVAVMSCMVPAPRAHRAEVVTVEGLSQDGQLHPVQQSFIDAGAVQCGYCTPGFLMSGAKLLEEYPSPTLEQIKLSITGNLCRCTGYYKILDAFRMVAEMPGVDRS